MDLREHTVYLRCSSWRDLLDDRRALAALLDSIEALTGTPFLSSRDLGGRRRRPAAAQAGRAALDAVSGLGLHAAARVRLSALAAAESDSPAAACAQSLLVHAGEHPYMGAYHTALDLRIPAHHFDEPAFVARFVAWVEAMLVPAVEPFMGHAHDTDDTAMQNVQSAALLERGFGVVAPPDFDPARQPGLEVSRGALRYLASWLMLIGPALREDLGAERVASLREGEHAERITEPLPGTTLVLLTASPREPASALARARQQAVREQLGFAERARATAHTWGYWDRRSREG